MFTYKKRKTDLLGQHIPAHPACCAYPAAGSPRCPESRGRQAAARGPKMACHGLLSMTRHCNSHMTHVSYSLPTARLASCRPGNGGPTARVPSGSSVGASAQIHFQSTFRTRTSWKFFFSRSLRPATPALGRICSKMQTQESRATSSADMSAAEPRAAPS